MPELPEVETTVRGLRPHVEAQRVVRVVLRRADLRWPIAREVLTLCGERIERIERRAKYILMHLESGTSLWHLGMSGSLRIVPSDTKVREHDHVDWALGSGMVMRFHDPRRFGSLMFAPRREGELAFEQHPLLRDLGPEPLSPEFSPEYLFEKTRKRSAAIKSLLMDQKHVVGVGNIYAAEALFAAGVRPTRQAQRVTAAECRTLVVEIKRILASAIERGGTTLRDFLNAEGEPGYFEQELMVYGREGEPCRVCKAHIRAAKLGTRQSLYCPKCQH
jgi:formamidopyrimidine-DNA glycosylase